MPKVILHYFSSKALGEPIRNLLVYGDQEFEDRRIPFFTKWPEIKPTMPFGQLPVLEIDGVKYSQSVTLTRYLGRKYGLAGKTLEEDMRIDEIVDYLAEIRMTLVSFSDEDDEEVKRRKRDRVFANYVPPALKRLDEIIQKNNGHLALGRLTWADFIFAGTFDFLKHLTETPDLEKKFPNFQRVVDAVYSIPKIKAYSEKAPPREFQI